MLNKKWFKFNPNNDTVVAFLTGLIMIITFYGWTHLFIGNEQSILYLIYTLLMLILVVIFPVWWMIWHRGYSFSELGLTREHATISILISFVLFLFFGALILVSYPLNSVIPNLMVGALSSWEAFFVFSWLQLRFDSAFGIIPSILLAASFFAGYHVGTVSLTIVSMLFLKDLILASAFRLTSNLLVIWPIAWITAQGLGTLWTFGPNWGSSSIELLSFVLLIQLAFLFYTSKRSQRQLLINKS